MGDESQGPRKLTPAEKLSAAESLYFSARELKRAALRRDHPEWPEEEVERRLRDYFLYERD